MKRLSSSDSLGALMSICPSTEEQSPRGNNYKHVYGGRDFDQSMMVEGGVVDEEGCIEECGGQIGEKKRRLSVDQVKALEKNFEVENKLEPERKVKLAQELGLQPRQVAVWFQNRRARWKTKQLERDYGLLKSNYEALKHNYDTLQHDNQSLLQQVRELKSKLQEENTESNLSGKEEMLVIEPASKAAPVDPTGGSDATTDLNYDNFNNDDNSNNNNNNDVVNEVGASIFHDMKDGSSDSDSSAILNEDINHNNSNNSSGSPNAAISSSSGSLIHHHHHQYPFSMSSPSSSSISCFQFSDSKAILGDTQRAYQPQFVKIEEHNFFSGEESCNFFSDEQAPTLQWYCPDQWN